MNLPVIFAFTGATFSIALALTALLRKPRTCAHWSFAAGMALLAAEATLNGVSLCAVLPETVLSLQKVRLLVASFLPGTWFLFSLSYSRGNYQEFLTRARRLLVVAFVLPVVLTFGFHGSLLVKATQINPTDDWSLELDW